MIIYVGTYSYTQAFKRALTILNKLYDVTNDIGAKCDQNDYLSVDLGMNNLCSCVSKDDCFILNGNL